MGKANSSCGSSCALTGSTEEVFRVARDFSSGLSLHRRYPSLRSGFRRTARTPRKHLNLLKRFAASTLEIFQLQGVLALWATIGRGGCMGRCGSVVFAIILLFLTAALLGCGTHATRAVPSPVPASISLSPANTVSIDVGSATQSFTATVQNARRQVIAEPVSFQSSNTAVVTVANNGLACAGTWDSLSVPQICTPGPVGVAQITATAQGVSSPPTTVYVHQHIDSIVVNPITTTPPPTPCVSKDQTVNSAATATSRGGGSPPGLDITSPVGPFPWQALAANVVKLSTTATELLPGQAQVTANVPGVTSIFASVSNVNSVPFAFITCPVQPTTLAVTASTATSKTITATVMDSLDTTINGIPLTWSSSTPAAISVTGSNSSASSGRVGTASAAAGHAGAAAIIASCTPPTCNIGFQPTLPIYPANAVPMVVTATGTPQSATVYVASKGCGTTSGCISTLIPITAPANTVGSAINLPATPNSLVFDPQGKNAFLGTDLGELGTKGLMVFGAGASTPTLSEFRSVTGRVLAVSPDGKKVIVSDTIATPNQVFVFDSTNNSNEVFPITGATAADFSPDNLKAFIVANNGSASTLYVYSLQDALVTVQLSSSVPANDAAFLPTGGFGYIAGGAASAVRILTTCFTNDPASLVPELTTKPTTGTPFMIRAVPDGTMLAVAPPGIDIFTPTVSGNGCAFQRPYPGVPPPPFILGTLAVSNAVSFFDLGQGNFVPTQLIISQDGTTAYILGETPPPNSQPVSIIVVFNIGNKNSSAFTLSPNAIPLQAPLTPDGTLLYIGASDGTVHVVDTVTFADIQQISFPQNPSTLQGGLCSGVTFMCNPDLIAVRP